MSQSLLYHAFGVREGYEYQKTDYVEGRVEFHLKAKPELLQCPECGRGPVNRRGQRLRRIPTVPIGFEEGVRLGGVAPGAWLQCGGVFPVFPPFAPPTP